MPIHEDGRRCVDGAVIRAFVFRVDQLGRVRQAVTFVRQHAQVRELGLRLFGVFQAFHGHGDHACLLPGEVFVPPFELDQLLYAERSPPAAEEDHYRVAVAIQVTLGERRAVGLRRHERREGLARCHLRPRIGLQARPQQKRALGTGDH